MRVALALLLAMMSAPGLGEVRPIPGVGDPRIQTVLYDPEQVIQLQVASGYQLTLEFGADERIETVAVGDSGAWQVTPNKRGDHLFIKANQSGVTTNMTVVTDARTYSFVLSPGFGTSPDMALVVKFKYPSPSIVLTATGATGQGQVGRYHLGGTKAVRPSAIDDDGVHTYVEWAPNQTMPAMFAVDRKGQETLINGMVRGGRYVIDSVANVLVFRLDHQIAYATRKPRLAIR